MVSGQRFGRKMGRIAQNAQKLAGFAAYLAENAQMVIQRIFVVIFFLVESFLLAAKIEVLVLPIIDIRDDISDSLKSCRHGYNFVGLFISANSRR